MDPNALVSAPDAHRAKVYSAEDQFTSLMNRGGKVEFFGSTLDIPVQKRFANIESIRSYVSGLFGESELVHALGLNPPTIRERKGSAKAHYEFTSQIIAIPVTGQSATWALRESVVLHECAHYVAAKFAPAGEQPHGPTFTASMLLLVQAALGDQARLLLATGYLEIGVVVGDHVKIFGSVKTP